MITNTKLLEYKQIVDAATAAPWYWNEWRVPDLMGKAGDTYVYDTEVIEATHSGECGCRSACTLELNISDEDKKFIATARTAMPELLDEIFRLRNALDSTTHSD